MYGKGGYRSRGATGHFTGLKINRRNVAATAESHRLAEY